MEDGLWGKDVRCQFGLKDLKGGPVIRVERLNGRSGDDPALPFGQRVNPHFCRNRDRSKSLERREEVRLELDSFKLGVHDSLIF